MALDYQIDTIDGLDENIASLYVEKDGKFVLDVADLPTTSSTSTDDLSGLKSALKKERDARKALEKQTKLYEGIDPDKHKEMAERIAELNAKEEASKRKEAEKKGLWEKLEQDLKLDHQRQLEAMQESAKQREAQLSGSVSEITAALEKHVGEKALIKALAAAEGNAVLLMPHVKNKVKVVKDDDGEYKARVIDDAGEIRYSKGGTYMTPDELILEIKERPEFKPAFKTKTKPGGSDSDGGHGGGSTEKNPFKKETENLTEQALLYKKDPQKAKQLKLEAGIK